MNANDFPGLANFFGGYFHQDWEFEVDTPEEVVQVFVREEHRETSSRAIKELRRLLSLSLTDEQLNKLLLGELGAYYDASPDTSRWLQSLLEVMEDEVRKATGKGNG